MLRCKSESHFIKDCPQPAKEGEEVNTFRPRYRQNYYSGQGGYNRREGGYTYRKPPHYINMRPRENNNNDSQRMATSMRPMENANNNSQRMTNNDKKETNTAQSEN